MRTIHKNAEPKALTEYRAAGHSSYEEFRDKEALRVSIRAEQRGLCCYCLSRIPGSRGMKIEHWRSQSEHPEDQLDYTNLLGSCMGNTGQPSRSQHCDTRKGNRELSRNPAKPADHVERFIQYFADGRIASNDPPFERELNEVLNLNEPRLVNNRKAVLDGFLLSFPTRGEIPEPQLRKWLRKWNGELDASDLEPFCQVIVYWLTKRLARSSGH